MSNNPSSSQRKRILLVAEAVTLAHVARMVALANALPTERYAVTLATDPRYNHLLGNLPYPVEKVGTIPGERFFRALRKGSPIYDTETLEAYVEEDRRLLAAHKPDLVVGDFRLSLDVSARLAGVPYATVTNAYWSPYARIGFPVPELPVTRLVGVRAGQVLFDLFRPLVSRLHARPMNQLRARHGMRPLPPDTRIIYTHADYTLYADLRELVPMDPLPANHRFLGPVLWSPPIDLPPWWGEVPGERPIAYVTLGSSGQSDVLPAVLEALESLGFGAMVATTGVLVARPRESGDVWLADYLPGEQAAARASVVICNGGSPTCYQALAAGVPVVGIPSNLDQYLNMSLVTGYGAGVLVRAGHAKVNHLAQAVQRAAGRAHCAERARSLQQAIHSRPSLHQFCNFVDATLLGNHG